MAKRKSVTGIRKKRPYKAPASRPAAMPAPRPPASVTSDEPSSHRAGSVALGPDVMPGKRTLVLIQNSRRRLQHDRVKKPAHRTQRQGSLKPTLKNVSQSIIHSKWKVLDQVAQAKVEALFQSIGLPVLAKHTKEASKVEAQDAIALVTRILCKRLPKMPFPSNTKLGHFDYDALAKNNRELQQRLKSIVNSINSSQIELENEKAQLQIESRELQQLEKALEEQEDYSASLPPLDETSGREDTPTAIGLAAD